MAHILRPMHDGPETAPFARKRHKMTLVTRRAVNLGKASTQQAAIQIGLELLFLVLDQPNAKSTVVDGAVQRLQGRSRWRRFR